MHVRLFMLNTVLIAAVGAALTVAADAQTANAKAVARTPWGDPDLQGLWTNTTPTPLQRPDDLKDKAVVTTAEQQRREAAFLGAPPKPGDTGGYNRGIWLDRGSVSTRTSLLVDPSGKLPPLTRQGETWKVARDEIAKNSPVDGPESRTLYERCITRGLPGAMLPGYYNHNYHILQTPEYVAILVEMIHDVRIIPIDRRPQVASGIRQWLGDSRGHWEGNTLVVETTNMKNINGTSIVSFSTADPERVILVFGTSGEKARIIERFTRIDADTIDYQITDDDPVTYTKPWTASIPMSRLTSKIFEYACHEGNYAMTGILGGARAEEKAAGEAVNKKNEAR